MNEICEKIRQLRTEQNLTLKELSDKTGLSISFLSQVERGISSLAITSLKKIADALDVPITSFFATYPNENFIIKIEEQKSFRLEGSDVDYTRLSGDFAGRLLEPLLVILPPGLPRSNVFNHPGEEFYYVLEGTVLFNVDGKEYLVAAGDSIHFPSKLTHFWFNPFEKQAKILCVLTPVIF